MSRPLGTPCVIFLDDHRWATFNQLSPLLRRAGVRTVRITTMVQARSKITSRLLYDRFEVLPVTHTVEALRRIIVSENVVDIQFVESLKGTVDLILIYLETTVANRVERRLSMTDKFAASRLLSGAGIRTPAVLAFADATPEEAKAKFGLPLVVKERTGGGGGSVVIAHDDVTLRSAAAAHESNPEETYYEEFIAGEKLNYGAAFSVERLEQELSYRITRWEQPVGTAMEVEVIWDEQLACFGRSAVRVSGCTGLINMDFVRDSQGQDWLVDFNARTFAGVASFRGAAIDLSQGYLRSLGLRIVPPEVVRPSASAKIRIFPTCLSPNIESGRITQTVVAYLFEARQYARWLGVRYWLSEALTTADALRIEHRRLRR